MLGKNSGKLTYPKTGFTFVDKSFAEKKAKQKISLKNICAKDVTKEAKVALVTSIADALNVPTFHVKVREVKDAPGSSCSSSRRRLGRHLSGSTKKVDVVYDVSFIKGEDQSATKTKMGQINTGAALSKIVTSISEATVGPSLASNHQRFTFSHFPFSLSQTGSLKRPLPPLPFLSLTSAQGKSVEMDSVASVTDETYTPPPNAVTGDGEGDGEGDGKGDDKGGKGSTPKGFMEQYGAIVGGGAAAFVVAMACCVFMATRSTEGRVVEKS